MKNRLYRPLTVFAFQTSSKQLNSPIWKQRCKAGRDLIRRLSQTDYESWITRIYGAQNAYQYHKMQERYSDDWYELEPLEIKALHYAVAIRFFCLPWTLAISYEDAECCNVEVFALAEYIKKNFQIKVKVTK